MRTVLTISDSVEGTSLDLLRSIATIKDFGLDPLSIVPRITYADGTSSDNDISEMLDYAFGECEFSAIDIGFITDEKVINYVADKLTADKKAHVICAPSLISDAGEIQVSSEVYSALSDKLFPLADFIVVNTFEAEAICGFECPIKNDFLRASKKIFNMYGCGVFIKGGEATGGMNVLFDGTKTSWVDPVTFKEGYEDKYNFVTAISCVLAQDKPLNLAANIALDFVSGASAPEVEAEPAVEVEAEPAVESTPAVEEQKVESEAEVEAAAEATVEVETYTEPEPARDVQMPQLTSSLVTPGKQIREMAREFAASANVNTEQAAATPAPAAVTSTIEKPEEPKGDVVPIASPRLKFDNEVKNSITELQSLRDRLNNLSKTANSGE